MVQRRARLPYLKVDFGLALKYFGFRDQWPDPEAGLVVGWEKQVDLRLLALQVVGSTALRR